MFYSSISVLLVLCGFTLVHTADDPWHYGGSTSSWPSLNITFNMCGGKMQTPVPIAYGEAMYKPQLRPLAFMVNGDTPAREHNLTMVLQNNGHSVALNFPDNTAIVTRLVFGVDPLTTTRVSHIHWHWGEVSSRGSEHSLNEKSYPMEGHLVTYNDKLYGNFTTAAKSPGGLAVFGILFEVVPEGQGHPVMEKISAAIMGNPNFQTIPTNDTTLTITEVPIFTLFHDTLSNYYRYMGSLTTPPCTENVLWTVSKKLVPITETQLKQFRSVKFSGTPPHAMVDNYRVMQELNPIRPDMVQRIITRSFNAAIQWLHPQPLVLATCTLLAVTTLHWHL